MLGLLYFANFRKNIDGVTWALAEVPPGTQVTVIGITDRSFAQPHILLSVSVLPDAGYFGERLGAARGQLAARWKTRSLTLRSDSPSTDVFGALLIASQIFSESPSGDRRMLVFFLDMRKSRSELNLERFQVLAHAQAARLPPGIVHADLRNAEVYALGVDGANRSAVYWQDLRQFWLGKVRNVSPKRQPALLRAFSFALGLSLPRLKLFDRLLQLRRLHTGARFLRFHGLAKERALICPTSKRNCAS